MNVITTMMILKTTILDTETEEITLTTGTIPILEKKIISPEEATEAVEEKVEVERAPMRSTRTIRRIIESMTESRGE